MDSLGEDTFKLVLDRLIGEACVPDPEERRDNWGAIEQMLHELLRRRLGARFSFVVRILEKHFGGIRMAVADRLIKQLREVCSNKATYSS
jgi:hypothetical protein